MASTLVAALYDTDAFHRDEEGPEFGAFAGRWSLVFALLWTRLSSDGLFLWPQPGNAMSIPAFDLGLVLPPFLGDRPGSSATQSPYRATTDDLVHRLGSTPERNTLLRGLLNLRAALRDIGVSNGFQWIDGSFVEDKERRLGIAPADIDVVTIFNRPAGLENEADWDDHTEPYMLTLFDPPYCKARYRCDAFYIDASRSGTSVATSSAFWFSLFSHQRDTFRWKGVVRCELGPAGIDDLADAELARRGA